MTEQALSASGGTLSAPSRTLLSCLIAGATLVGLLPYALFLGRHEIAIVAIGTAVVTAAAAMRLRGIASFATEAPAVGEILLAAWNAVAFGALLSLLGMTVHWGIGTLLRLVRWLVGLFGGTLSLAIETWSFWGSLAFAAMMALGVGFAAADEQSKKLYPDTAGVRSPFFSLLAEPKRLLVAGLVSAAALAAILIFFDHRSTGFSVALAVYLFYTGISLESLQKSGGGKPGRSRAVQAVGKLLAAAGYQWISSPRTGRSQVDPLICTVDLLAISPRQALVIEIKGGDDEKQPVEWHEASRVSTAAWALQDVLREEQPSLHAQPMLVLIGRRPGESLHRYLRDEHVALAQFPDAKALDRVLSEEDSDRLRSLAVEHLGLKAVASSGTIPALGPPVSRT
ncbi:MAG TPA: hypothetical protein VNB06_15660 [Thermoanaerobaculia bacterium]|nr:hypothetical protein [Thermoanaerobaculia bacterium]